MTPLRQRMIEDLRVRNYSPKTQTIYVAQVARFARHFGVSPEQLGPEEVRLYQLHLIEQGVSWSTFNQTVCALRFLYKITLGRSWAVKHLPFGKKPRCLPCVLSREEVEALLSAAHNAKHRAVLMTLYSTGLRVSEVAQLRLEDIDSQRMLIRVRQGKGRKDRVVMLSPVLLDHLRAYRRAQPRSPWLFPGSEPDQPLSVSAIQKVCGQAGRKAGILLYVRPLGKHRGSRRVILPRLPCSSSLAPSQAASRRTTSRAPFRYTVRHTSSSSGSRTSHQRLFVCLTMV